MAISVTVSATQLAKIKTAIPLTSDDTDLNTEITDLVQECVNDLLPADVLTSAINLNDPMIFKAVKTYVKMHFGEPVDYDKLKVSYEVLKAQLGMSSDYGDYSMLEEDEE